MFCLVLILLYIPRLPLCKLDIGHFYFPISGLFQCFGMDILSWSSNSDAIIVTSWVLLTVIPTILGWCNRGSWSPISGFFLLVCRCVHRLTPFAIQVFFLMCCVCLPVRDNLPGGYGGKGPHLAGCHGQADKRSTYERRPGLRMGSEDEHIYILAKRTQKLETNYLCCINQG